MFVWRYKKCHPIAKSIRDCLSSWIIYLENGNCCMQQLHSNVNLNFWKFYCCHSHVYGKAIINHMWRYASAMFSETFFQFELLSIDGNRWKRKSLKNKRLSYTYAFHRATHDASANAFELVNLKMCYYYIQIIDGMKRIFAFDCYLLFSLFSSMIGCSIYFVNL